MDGISAIIPCYNGEGYLRPCLDSVIGQDYGGPLEVLVVDDGSRDASLRIAESYGAAVRVLQHPGGENRGSSATRNLGIRSASHPLLAFLDADDLWLPGHLAALAAALAANPAAGMAYDNGSYMTAEGNQSTPRLASNHTAPDPETLLRDCCLVPAGVLVRKAVFQQVGLFD